MEAQSQVELYQNMNHPAWVEQDEWSSLFLHSLQTLRMQGQNNWMSGNREEAWLNWSKALELEPYDVQTLLLRARAYQESQQWEHAIKDLSRLLEHSPRLTRAYLIRSECYHAWGKTSLAIADALHALRCAEPGMPDIPQIEQQLQRLAYKGPTAFPPPESPSRAEWMACLEDMPPSMFAQIQGYYEQAKQHSAWGKPDLAVLFWSSAIALNPNLFESYIGRANAYRMLGHNDMAFTDLEKAILLCPHSDHAFHQRAILRWEQGDIYDAIADLEQALRIFPHHVDYYAQCGLFYLAVEQTEQAILYFSKAVELDPTDVTSLSHLAQLFFRQGQAEQAIAYADTLLLVSPQDPDTLLLKGDALAQCERWSESLEHWMSVVPQRPRDPEIFQRIAQAHRHLQQHWPALEATLIAQYWLPTNPATPTATTDFLVGEEVAALGPEPQFLLLENLLDATEEEAVLAVVCALLQKVPNCPALWCLLGRVHHAMGEYEQAQISYRRAWHLNPQHTQTLFYWGCFRLERGFWQDGVSDLKQALDLAQTQGACQGWIASDAYLRLAEAYKQENLWQESAEALQQSLGLQPEQPLVWVALGDVCATMQQPEQSIQAFSRALVLAPELAMAWFSRACVYGQLGHKEAALRDLQQAISRNARYQEKASSHPSFSQWFLPDPKPDHRELSCYP